jgi:hypothetical protein
MASTRFQLTASVSTDSPSVIHPVLVELLGASGSVKEPRPGEFAIQAELEGTSAKELNRWLLSSLRKAEKRTRLRAEWSSGGITERYFDSVLKSKVSPGRWSL